MRQDPEGIINASIAVLILVSVLLAVLLP